MAGFEVPRSFDGPGFRLEPLGPEHNQRDHEAWMSSIEHIQATPGFPMPDGWPKPMPLERNLQDLVDHAQDFSQRRGFTYTVLDGEDVIGCVYIYPSRREGHDAQVRTPSGSETGARTPAPSAERRKRAVTVAVAALFADFVSVAVSGRG